MTFYVLSCNISYDRSRTFCHYNGKIVNVDKQTDMPANRKSREKKAEVPVDVWGLIESQYVNSCTMYTLLTLSSIQCH